MSRAYNLTVLFVEKLLPLIGVFNKKLKRFYFQRKNTVSRIEEWSKTKSNKPIAWFHCASLGEYEMIVPIIRHKLFFEKYETIITFFSESGYNHSKILYGTGSKFYLPIDSLSKMRRMVTCLNPSLFVLVKYELWFNLLKALEEQSIRRVLVNGNFINSHFVFGFFGKPYQQKLKNFERIYVLNESVHRNLVEHGFTNSQVLSDLRYTRVAMVAESNTSHELIERFVQNKTTLIIGSSWPHEEDLVLRYLLEVNPDIRVIIAPHDVSEPHILEIVQKFKNVGVSRISAAKDHKGEQVLILDTIGHLSSAYQYADIAFVGGAFGKGLHNVLEALAFGLPIITGPKISKFPEALELQNEGLLVSIQSYEQGFVQTLRSLIDDVDRRNQLKVDAKLFLKAKTGELDSFVKELL